MTNRGEVITRKGDNSGTSEPEGLGFQSQTNKNFQTTELAKILAPRAQILSCAHMMWLMEMNICIPFVIIVLVMLGI